MIWLMLSYLLHMLFNTWKRICCNWSKPWSESCTFANRTAFDVAIEIMYAGQCGCGLQCLD